MTTALWVHWRAELRRRWVAWLAVVLLIGLVGGAVLGALAGARRTATAHDRMVASTEAWHVLVNPNEGTGSELRPGEVATLPQVARLGTMEGGTAQLLDPAGDPGFAAPLSALTLVQGDPDVLVEFARPHVVEGRMFDARAVDEIVLSDDVADEAAAHVGDTVPVGTIDAAAFEAWEEGGAEGPPPVDVHDVTVVGIVVPPDDVVSDDAFTYGTAYLPYGFRQAHDFEPYFYGMAVRLAGGADDIPAFREAVRELVPDEAIEFQTMASVSDTVARGTRPHVLAVLAFAVVVGLAGTVVSAQAVARQLDQLAREESTLKGIGLVRRQVLAAAVGRAAVLAGLGAIVAAVVAVAISPLFPVGISRRAEIDRGIDIDLLVLGPGLLALFVVTLGWAAASARRGTVPASRPTVRRSSTEAVGRVLPGPVATMGTRAALSGSAGGAGASSRGAVAGLAVAAGAVAGVVVFGSNLDHLVSTPAAYGYPWGTLISPPGELADSEIIERLTGDARVETRVLQVDQVYLDGERVPAVGIDTSATGPGLSIVAGREPADVDEVALGRRTMARLGVGVGDSIVAGSGGDRRSLEVVGQAVFPGIGTYPGADRTELGKGALLDSATLREVGERFDFAYVAVDAADRATLDAAVADAISGHEETIAEGELEIFDGPQRPADIQSLERVRSTPQTIAAVLALLAAAAVTAVLLSGVRARRRELALLKTFGFGRRQVAATVLWQASVTALMALAVGVPIGVVAGRLAWSALAGGLGVATDATVPISVMAVPVGVLVLAVVVALVPGRLAAGIRPAVALRSE